MVRFMILLSIVLDFYYIPVLINLKLRKVLYLFVHVLFTIDEILEMFFF